MTAASVSGSVSVDGIKGDLSASSVSGTVRIANAGRVSSAKSVSGSVEVLDTQIDGGIEVQSVSGNVVLRKVNARQIEASSVSGEVQIQDVQAERIEGHSVSGNVEYSGTLAKGGRYELQFALRGRAPDDWTPVPGFELEASSFSGSIRSDLPLKRRPRFGLRTRTPPQRERGVRRRQRRPRCHHLLRQHRHFQTLTASFPFAKPSLPEHRSHVRTWHVAAHHKGRPARLSHFATPLHASRTPQLPWRMKTAAFYRKSMAP